MHIAIVTGPFLPVPPAPSGAVERIWQELAEEFAAKGHRVQVYCRGHETQRFDETILGVRYRRTMRLTRTGKLPIDLCKDFAYSIRSAMAIEHADIIVTNSFWLPAILSVRPRGAKIVVNVARMPKGQLWLYRDVDRLAAVSTAVGVAIQNEQPALARITRVIGNPIDLNVFKPLQPIQSSTSKSILYAGRIHPEKGVHLLVAAFRALSSQFTDWRLKLLGPTETNLGGGGDKYVRILKDLAAGLSVEFCAPTFNKEELANEYRTAGIFCYPSLAEFGESFGMAPLEAMACGLVPVVSDLECFRDFIEPRVNGEVFDHRSKDAAAALAATLRSMLQRFDALQSMRTQAILSAQRFSRGSIASQYLDDFEGLLQQRAVAGVAA